MNKTILVIVIGVIVLVAAAMLMNGDMKPGEDLDATDTVNQVDVSDTTDSLSEDTCVAAGGTWNTCGSACRANPDDICIEVCVEYCECESDDQCPESYSCTDYVDSVGVCETSI